MKGGSSGGQLKVRDVFEYVRQMDDFEPHVYFPPETRWTDYPGNLWLNYRDEALKVWNPVPGDILFLAGKDWGQINPDPTLRQDIPIVAIAQPRHVRPEDPRQEFLQHRAVRVAKSQSGLDILKSHGVNGPIFCIPDAIDFSVLPSPHPDPPTDLLIVGMKNVLMARELHLKLRRKFGAKLSIEMHDGKMPTREDFLRLLNRCRVACFFTVPPEKGLEGFYLPALEAMVLRKLVICPDAIGNRDFCLANRTCILPEYNVDSYFDAVVQAFEMTDEAKEVMISNAAAQAKAHNHESERQSYWDLFRSVDEIWTSSFENP